MTCFRRTERMLSLIHIYTDFPNEENRADAFLENVDFSSISHDGLCIPLPIDLSLIHISFLSTVISNTVQPVMVTLPLPL